jgi:uncharacterized membrane protein
MSLDVKNSDKRRWDIGFTLVSSFLTLLFCIVPTGFEGASQARGAERVRGRIIEVNNERIINTGPVKQGEQQLEVEILSGRFKGRVFSGSNNLMGKIELDKMFAPGDMALVVVSFSEDGGAGYAQVIDHYRTGKTVLLCLLFLLFIIFIMGWMGIKIVITFVFTATAMIRVLFPAMLRGWDPIFASVVMVTVITAVIIFLVGGITRRGLTAFAGSMGGVLLTSCLAYFFTYWFKIHEGLSPRRSSIRGHESVPPLHLDGHPWTRSRPCLFRRVHRHDHDLQGIPLENGSGSPRKSPGRRLILVAPLTVFAGGIILSPPSKRERAAALNESMTGHP